MHETRGTDTGGGACSNPLAKLAEALPAAAMAPGETAGGVQIRSDRFEPPQPPRLQTPRGVAVEATDQANEDSDDSMSLQYNNRGA